MRGARLFVLPACLPLGITPAYAGSTLTTFGRVTFCGDHPRVCGEHNIFLTPEDVAMGSPPRMRGAPAAHGAASRSRGITPAYAGSTCLCGSPGCRRGDHPRVCGEHWQRPRIRWISVGSPPRMRGALRRSECRADSDRITPAYAGSTDRGSSCRRLPRDHPRVCGEHELTLTSVDYEMGSPPRMRGARRPCAA